MANAFLDNVIRFLEVLRAGGIGLHAGRTSEIVVALEQVGLRRRDDVRATLRSLVIHKREDLAPFDRAFEAFWRARAPRDADGLPLLALGERPRVDVTPRAGTRVQFHDDVTGSAGTPSALAAAAWSAAESLRSRDFATLSQSELRQAEDLLARLPWHLGLRRTRRWSRARSGSVDLRAAVRRNMKHGGELLELPRRACRVRPRPIVVLADVSGSMEVYARMLLQFVHGMSAGPHTVESFAFATRLTRITREVGRRSGAEALSAVAARVGDWGGGTRIGDILWAFNLHYARRVMRHGPIVLIVSDGWDRGDPQQLAHEMAKLRQRCRRLVWLNPLLGSASYEPLTRGMVAALPFIDDFLPAHNLVSLEQLATHLQSLIVTQPTRVSTAHSGIRKRTLTREQGAAR